MRRSTLVGLGAFLFLALACTGPVSDGSTESGDSRGDSNASQAICEAFCAGAEACAADLGEDCVTDCRESVTDPDLLEEMACFTEALHASACDVELARASCLTEEEADQDHEPFSDTPEDEEDPLGYLSLLDLECTAEGCGSDVVDPYGQLAAAYAAFEEAFPEEGSVLYAGVRAGGHVDEGALQIRSDSYFAEQDFEPDPEGYYTIDIDNWAVSTDVCGSIGIQLDPARDGEPGGICGTLAVAHSLVNRLNVVKSTWDNVYEDTDGDGVKDSWDPDFIKAIQDASGNDDGNRGLDLDEIEDAHTADWNEKWTVENTWTLVHWESMPYIIGNPQWYDDDCDDLKEWCEDIAKATNEWDDDCIITMHGGGLAGFPFSGHAIAASKVTWNESECRCEVIAADTGKQDSPKNDYKGVPKSPGFHTWTFGKMGDIGVIKGSNQNFWNDQPYSSAKVHCFDEDPRFSYLGLKKREDKPGDAFPD